MWETWGEKVYQTLNSRSKLLQRIGYRLAEMRRSYRLRYKKLVFLGIERNICRKIN